MAGPVVPKIDSGGEQQRGEQQHSDESLPLGFSVSLGLKAPVSAEVTLLSCCACCFISSLKP